MTRISFYVLKSGQPLDLICRLTEKAYISGQSVYVHVPSEKTAQQLDERLWSFRDGSFVPHEFYTGDPEVAAVLIGHDEPPPGKNQILINTGDEVPLFFSRFERTLELVAGDESQRKNARRRYMFYKDRGYPLESHDIS